jgi:large subunit ribosomal protein L6
MSRIGKKVIVIPAGVTVEKNNKVLQVKGPLGVQMIELLNGIDVTLEGQELHVLCNEDPQIDRLSALHGLSRALIANMITGVSKGFSKDLDIVGVGYRAQQQNKNIVLQLGFSHNVTFTPPDGITIEVLEPTKLRVKGINKQAVGQVSANIRELRPPEPYKGKGIRYKDERVRKKAGKAGKK